MLQLGADSSMIQSEKHAGGTSQEAGTRWIDRSL